MTSKNEKIVRRAVKELGISELVVRAWVKEWAAGNPDVGSPSYWGVTIDQVNKIFAIYAEVHGIELC